jgi:hypothetical protein
VLATAGAFTLICAACETSVAPSYSASRTPTAFSKLDIELGRKLFSTIENTNFSPFAAVT